MSTPMFWWSVITMIPYTRTQPPLQDRQRYRVQRWFTAPLTRTTGSSHFFMLCLLSLLLLHPTACGLEINLSLPHWRMSPLCSLCEQRKLAGGAISKVAQEVTYRGLTHTAGSRTLQMFLCIHKLYWLIKIIKWTVATCRLLFQQHFLMTFHLYIMPHCELNRK